MESGPVGVVVQKFGGSSVASVALMKQCAQRVLAERRGGHRVVVVVSAMGDTTDDLIGLAGQTGASPDRRELDQLLATGEQASTALMAMVLHAEGIPALSLTGWQAGISTDGAHSKATITGVDSTRLSAELELGKVPVVAGFQGRTVGDEITTLGRGGSDTTAVALAASLAGRCDIYKDVEGVYTADPRLVPGARRRERVTYDEMLEAASLGSQVLHPRAVELGKKFGVPIRVLHSHIDGLGTLIVADDPSMESRVVSSVVLKRGVGRIVLRDLPNAPGVQARVFEPIAAVNVCVDDIIQEEAAAPGRVNLTFTVDRKDLESVRPAMERLCAELGGAAVRVDTGLCTVSAVGAGMRSGVGVASTMFRALAQSGLVIENVTTSEIRVSCVLREEAGEYALRAVHEAFGLGHPDSELRTARMMLGTSTSGV